MSIVPEGVKNLIFDFGGVIINIDFNRTFDAFTALGISDVRGLWEKILSEGILYDMEKGKFTPDEFRQKMYTVTGINVSDDVFDKAWNSMLLDIPEERVRLIEKLKKNYRVYLLSNTNEIHYNKYCGALKQYGYDCLDDLFNKAYFSFRMGKLKPGVEIFEEVIKNENLNPVETLFIDDLKENVTGAEKAGLKGLYIEPGTLSEVFCYKSE